MQWFSALFWTFIYRRTCLPGYGFSVKNCLAKHISELFINLFSHKHVCSNCNDHYGVSNRNVQCLLIKLIRNSLEICAKYVQITVSLLFSMSNDEPDR